MTEMTISPMVLLMLYHKVLWMSSKTMRSVTLSTKQLKLYQGRLLQTMEMTLTTRTLTIP